MTRVLCLLFSAFCSLLVRGQSVTSDAEVLYFSDHYLQAVEWQGQLVLANDYGLFLYDLNDLSGPLSAVVKVAGSVGELVVNGPDLLVSVPGEGFHVYGNQLGSRKPRWIHFQAVPGLKTLSANKGFVLCGLDEKTLILEKKGAFEYRASSEAALRSRKFIGIGNLVFSIFESRVSSFLLSDSGQIGNVEPVSFADTDLFYDIHLQGDRIIFDSPAGVSWARYSSEGVRIGFNSIYRQNFSEVLLGSFASETHLYLLFADHLDVYSFQAQDNLIKIGSLPLGLVEQANTRFFPTKGRLHLLNQEVGNRTWSYKSYTNNTTGIKLQIQLPAILGNIAAVMSNRDRIYLASGASIYDGGIIQHDQLRALKKIFTLESSPTAITTGGEYFYVVLPNGLANSTLKRLRVLENGSVVEDFSKNYDGILAHLSYNSGSLSFSQQSASKTSVKYRAHVLLVEPDLELKDVWIEKNISLTNGGLNLSPFLDLQVTPAGLLYRDQSKLYLLPDLRNLSEQSNRYSFEENLEPSAVQYFRGGLLIEAKDGVRTAQLSGDQVQHTGFYPQWKRIRPVGSEVALAENQMEPLPSRLFLLDREGNDSVQSELYVDGSQDETNLIFTTNRMVQWDKDHISASSVINPAKTFLYPLPKMDQQSFALELANQEAPGQTASIRIYDRNGKLIGRQQLTESLLGVLNRNNIEDWLFDYNHNETPVSAVIESSYPLDPVLSGKLQGVAASMFAVEMLPAGPSQLFIPHVPRDLGLWDTKFFVRNQDEQGNTLTYQSASGFEISESINPGMTHQFHLNGVSQNWPGPWGTVSSPNLDDGLEGFAIYKRVETGQAAAVQLSNRDYKVLYVPFLADNAIANGWTGLAIANLQATPTSIQFVGYSEAGTVVMDGTRVIEGNDSGVYLAEMLIEEFHPEQPVTSMVILTSQPVQGIALYGNSENGNLAGISLTDQASRSVRWTGIRAELPWLTQILITNLENGEGSIQFEAYDAFGHLLSSALERIPSRGQLFRSVTQLFPGLSNSDRGQIQTLVAHASKEVTACAFRARENQPGWDAVSAFPTSKAKQ